MKYEHDSWENCTSPMKRTHNFFSAAHFATPFPTVNCQLLTVNWIHTFSAKEKDTETGLSYFGSRYYSSDLSIWLSVDPMSDKYPSLSPYAYCANNPIKIVDPDGCFGVPIHQDVTRQAINKTNIKLKFGQSFCDNLIKGVKKADQIGFAADWHFDNRANYSEVKARWNSPLLIF